MKIIDLLNKIANGENIKNIKYQNHIYEYYNGDFREEIDGIMIVIGYLLMKS